MDSSGLIVPFGRYVLKERLAQGGMGEVFRAVAIGEHGFEKPVVVKRVLPAHAGRDDLTDLFVAEAKLMTRLAHPNIVEVLDFGRGEHKDYYLVLELVDGTDLGRLLRAFAARGEPFPIPLALFVAAQVLRGLHHAHTKSAGEGDVIVHRDVSPSNVLCGAEGEVKVADFGVALVAHGSAGTGGVAGKPGYMAPEQFDGGLVDPRADVFSAGVVLHQMLTGSLPFAGDTVDEQQDAARRGARVKARDLRAEVSEAIDAILAQALAASPSARFSDARAMAQAIEGLRDRGQRIATGDDLGEAVRSAQRELPAAGRRVIALSSASPTGHDGSDPDAPRELTRSGAAGGVGAFTLRFPVRADTTTQQQDGAAERSGNADRWATPEPRTERIALDAATHASTLDPLPVPSISLDDAAGSAPRGPSNAPRTPASERRAPSSERAPARRVLVLAIAAALLGALVLVVRSRPHDEPRDAAVPPPPPPPPSAAPVARVSAPTAEPVVSAAPPAPAPVRPVVSHPSAVVAPIAPPPVVAPIAPPSVLAPAVAPSSTAAASAPSQAASAKEGDCAGDVSFYSIGAWIVSGGPRPVESPAKVIWPCGTFSLVAHSRADPTQVKSTTLSVQPKRVAIFDLR